MNFMVTLFNSSFYWPPTNGVFFLEVKQTCCLDAGTI